MPLDNDTYDVKMLSLEGKAWAGANGDWVVYIGYNCEWELVNVYTRQQIPLPKISECPKVEHTDDLRTFKYDHGDDTSPTYLLFQTLLPLFWTLTCMI